MAQSVIPRPSESRTLRSSYGSFETSSISAPVDAIVDLTSRRPASASDLVALVFIGFSPASSWETELMCKEVLFDSNGYPYGFAVRTKGSSPQKYYVRYMWLYYA